MCVLLQSARLWFEVLRFEELMYYGLCTIKQWYNKTINTRFEKQWTQGFTAVSGVSRSSYGRSALIHSVYRHAARLPTAQLSAVVRLSIKNPTLGNTGERTAVDTDQRTELWSNVWDPAREGGWRVYAFKFIGPLWISTHMDL